ncbi:MAG TPA: hypothetical protein GX707_03050 [Epulopiscium sp.]|nr:hypothetical protein [Candidatus Epulonipiscium sp.]
MLKLLKYELKQTWKMCTTLIGFTLIGCIGLLLNPFNEHSVIFPLYILLCGLIIAGSMLFIFFYCMESFNRDFTRPQGYLTMTLPIKARNFIWAKFINQGIWNTIGVFIIMGTSSWLIKDHIGLQSMGKGMDQGIFIQSMINGIASYILTVFIVYFSIVLLSKEPRDNQCNFIKVILAIILSYVTNIITALSSVFIPYSFKYGIPISLKHIEQLAIYVEQNIGNINLINVMISLIIAGIFYFMIEYIIDNKVQL